MKKEEYQILINLNGCIKGSVFKPCYDGKQYYRSAPDEDHEAIRFRLPSEIVENSPELFEKITPKN